MDLSLKEFVQIVFSVAASGGATYAAIRSNLASLNARMKLVEESADKAHERVDAIMMKGLK